MPPNQKPPGTGLSIAAMVCGIVGLVFSFFLWFIGLPTAVVGLVLAIIGKKKLSEVGATSGMATAGLVTSIIALSLATIVTIVCLTVCSAVGQGIGCLADMADPYYW